MVYETCVLSVAVMTLREFQREAARKSDETKEIRHFDVDRTKHGAFNKQPKAMEQNNNPAPVRTVLEHKTLFKTFLSLFCI